MQLCATEELQPRAYTVLRGAREDAAGHDISRSVDDRTIEHATKHALDTDTGPTPRAGHVRR